MSITSTITSEFIESYQQTLIAGDRDIARRMIEKGLENGQPARALINELIWPTMEFLQASYREDRINVTQLNLATRLNRSITHDLTQHLDGSAPNGRRVLILCGNDEPEELGGQICSDLFESAGYTVRFAGGGIPNDDVLKLIGEFRPNLLVVFGTLPSGMPAVRKLVDYLRDVNSCPDMQVMCCGGIYKRAPGLAEEIGADLFAPDAAAAVEVAETNQDKRATVDQQTVGKTRRIRKAAARKSADAGYAEAA